MAMDGERTFHTTDSAYVLPNDAPEHERLEHQSRALVRMMHDQPIHAPLVHPERILEIGCGTGVMTAYLAARYPDARDVIGVDLSAVPEAHRSNRVTFIQGDFHQLAKNPDWPALSANSFDYVFSRLVVFGITDWPGYIAQAKEMLKSGGWIELQELDARFFNGDGQTISNQWPVLQEFHAAGRKRGFELDVGRSLEGYLKDAGFVDIQVRQYRWVYGKWLGHPETDMIGEYSCNHLGPAIWMGYKKLLGPNKTPDEMKLAHQELLERIAYTEEGKHQAWYVVCGRKP